MKPSLVLISGLLSNEALWKDVIVRLVDLADITVVCPTDDSPEEMLRTILEKAPKKFCLAGHSMGGWLALEVMRHAQDRVEKLLLLNTTARNDTPEKASRRKNMIQEAENGGFEDVVQQIAQHFVYNRAVLDAVKEMFLEVGKDAFCNQERAMLKRSESISILSSIACRTFVVHAEHDKVFSLEEHQELVRLIPGAAFRQVEGSGHMSPMEQPEGVCGIIKEWLM